MRVSKNNLGVHFAAIVLILISITALFSPSLNYEFSRIDDNDYVEANGDIRRINLESIQKWFSREYVSLYVPLTMASFALDYQIWHFDSFGYRFTNLILHFLNAVLVYFLIYCLIGNSLIAVSTALIFAIHPVQIESVVWISERKNLLSTLFFLFAIFFHFFSKYRFVIGLFILAVLSKPNTVVLPFILIAIDFLIKPALLSKNQKIFYYGSFIAISILVALVTFILHGDTEIFFRGNSFLKNLYIMVTIFFRYVQLLVFPYHQQFFYMSEIYEAFTHPHVIFSFIGFSILLGLIFYWRKKYSYVAFWLMWFVILLAPVSNIFTPIGTLMNDRYLYLPIIGFFTMFFLLVHKISKGCLYPVNIQLSKELIGSFFFTGVIVASFILTSINRISAWETTSKLFQEDLMKSEYFDNRYLSGLAAEKLKKGDIESAVLITEAQFNMPVNEEALLRQAASLLYLQKPNEAFDYLDFYHKFSHSKFTHGYFSLLGQYYEQQGNLTEAEENYKKSSQIHENVFAYLQLSALYRKQGKLKESSEMVKLAQRIDPDAAHVLVEQYALAISEKKVSEAYETYLNLRRLHPKHLLVQKVSNAMKQS